MQPVQKLSPNIVNILEDALTKRRIPAKKRARYLSDFFSIMAGVLLIKAATRLSASHQKDLEKLILQHQFAESINLVYQTFTPKEWEVFYTKNLAPLVDNYIQEVFKDS